MQYIRRLYSESETPMSNITYKWGTKTQLKAILSFKRSAGILQPPMT